MLSSILFLTLSSLSLSSSTPLSDESSHALSKAKKSNLNLIPLTKTYRTPQNKKKLLRRASGSETLIDSQSQDGLYMGNISIVQFDTGSSDLWVYETGVTSQHPTFNPSSSSTFKNDSVPWAVQYGDGTSTSGYVANDTVSFAGLTVPQQGFAVATTTSQELNSEPEDGLIGLGFQDLAEDGSFTFFENLLKNGTLDQSYFGVFLQRDETESQEQKGGSICFGCLDSSKYTGSISYNTVTSRTRWAINLASLSANSHSISIPSTVRMDIDTGSSLIVLPTSLWSSLGSAIGAQGVEVSGGNYLEISCSNFWNLQIEFGFGSQVYTVGPTDLYIGQDGQQNCIIGIQGLDQTDDDGVTPLGILGDAFLKNVYTVFKYDNGLGSSHSIGFATSSQSSNSSSSGSGSGSSGAAGGLKASWIGVALALGMTGLLL